MTGNTCFVQKPLLHRYSVSWCWHYRSIILFHVLQALSFGCNPFSISDSFFFLSHFWKWLLYFYMNMHTAYIHTSYIMHYTCIDLFCKSAECLSIIQYSFTWHSLDRSFDKTFKGCLRVPLRLSPSDYFIFFIGPFVIYYIYYYAYLKKTPSHIRITYIVTYTRTPFIY